MLKVFPLRGNTFSIKVFLILFFTTGTLVFGEGIALTDGWQYRWGDSPKDPSGVPIWAKSYDNAGEWQDMETLRPASTRGGKEYMW